MTINLCRSVYDRSEVNRSRAWGLEKRWPRHQCQQFRTVTPRPGQHLPGVATRCQQHKAVMSLSASSSQLLVATTDASASSSRLWPPSDASASTLTVWPPSPACSPRLRPPLPAFSCCGPGMPTKIPPRSRSSYASCSHSGRCHQFQTVAPRAPQLHQMPVPRLRQSGRHHHHELQSALQGPPCRGGGRKGDKHQTQVCTESAGTLSTDQPATPCSGSTQASQ